MVFSVVNRSPCFLVGGSIHGNGNGRTILIERMFDEVVTVTTAARYVHSLKGNKVAFAMKGKWVEEKYVR